MQPVDEARRERDSRRWLLSDAEYLRQHNVAGMLRAALRHVAARACLNPRLNPVDALADYFKRAVQGPVAGIVEYTAAVETPRGRRDVLRTVGRTLAPWVAERMSLGADDCHLLLTMSIPDFPREPVTDAARIATDEGKITTDDGKLPLQDFMQALQLRLFFAEDLAWLEGIFLRLKRETDSVAMLALCQAVATGRDGSVVYPCIPLTALLAALLERSSTSSLTRVQRYLVQCPAVAQAVGSLPFKVYDGTKARYCSERRSSRASDRQTQAAAETETETETAIATEIDIDTETPIETEAGRSRYRDRDRDTNTETRDRDTDRDRYRDTDIEIPTQRHRYRYRDTDTDTDTDIETQVAGRLTILTIFSSPDSNLIHRVLLAPKHSPP